MHMIFKKLLINSKKKFYLFCNWCKFYNNLNNVLLNYFTKANVNISKINTNLKGNLKKKIN